MDWILVDNNKIEKIAYQDNHLYVKFHTGEVYKFENVSQRRYEWFIKAPNLRRALLTLQKNRAFYPVSIDD